LSKTEWGNIHINLGLLFILSIGLHVYYNWKTIISYLKNKAKQIKVFTKEFNAALVLSAIFVFGTYLFVPPFSWVLEINESIKNSATMKYGEPPYGHAELSSLKTFTNKMALDLAQSLERLKEANIKFNSAKQTIKEIAKENNMSPKQLYLAMKPAEAPGMIKKMPNIPPPGLGKRSLAGICKEYSLDIKTVLRGFAKHDMNALPDLNINKIAQKNNMNPIEIYEKIKELSSPTSK